MIRTRNKIKIALLFVIFLLFKEALVCPYSDIDLYFHMTDRCVQTRKLSWKLYPLRIISYSRWLRQWDFVLPFIIYQFIWKNIYHNLVLFILCIKCAGTTLVVAADKHSFSQHAFQVKQIFWIYLFTGFLFQTLILHFLQVIIIMEAVNGVRRIWVGLNDVIVNSCSIRLVT